MAILNAFIESIDTKDDDEFARLYKKVPYGIYEVSVEKMELLKIKNTSQMITIWFKVLEGVYEGDYIIINQMLTQNYQIYTVNELLRSLCLYTHINNDFIYLCQSQYKDLINRIFLEVNANYEYILKYLNGGNGQPIYIIDEVFSLMED